MRCRIDFHWTDPPNLSEFRFLYRPLPVRQTEGNLDQLVYVRGLSVCGALVVAGILYEPVLIPMLHEPIAELHQVVMVDFVHEAPSRPFFKLPERLPVRLQCVRLKRDLYAVQPPFDGNRDSFSLLL